MKQLFLEDLKGMTEDEIKKHLATQYGGTGYEKVDHDVWTWLKDARVLLAYESVGSWGCDSSSYFLFKKSGGLFDIHGSHCSCYGFEDQFKPESVTVEFLQSEKFSFYCGGYDSIESDNKSAILEFIKGLKQSRKPTSPKEG